MKTKNMVKELGDRFSAKKKLAVVIVILIMSVTIAHAQMVECEKRGGFCMPSSWDKTCDEIKPGYWQAGERLGCPFYAEICCLPPKEVPAITPFSFLLALLSLLGLGAIAMRKMYRG